MPHQSLSDVARQYGLSLEREEFFHPTELEGVVAASQAILPKSVAFRGAHNRVILGAGADTNTNIKISGNRCVVVVGAHAKLRGSTILVTGDDQMFWFGAFSTAGELIASAKDGASIVIGDECMFSNRVYVDTSDHHAIYDVDTGCRINMAGNIDIRRHVWVGRDVRISKGAVIGADSIVGQASIVNGTACADPGCIYAGAPARKLRDGVTWSRASFDSLAELEASSRHAQDLQAPAELDARCVQP